ncbi:hypothetical protein ACETKC_06940 [Brevundimonas intermedia]|nr:hypothetical protein [Brevundimonas intermedia]
MWLVIAAAFAISGQQQDSGQDRTISREATEVESIEVTGRRLEDAARDFARSVDDRPPLGTLPGRWAKPLCISVAHFRAPWGQYVSDGVGRRAAEVGLDVGGPGCRTNVLIVGAEDGARMADSLIRADRRRFRDRVDHSSKDLFDLERFRTSDAPVRWWHITYPRSIDEGVLMGGRSLNSPDASAPVMAVRAPSLIRPTLRYDIETVTVVIDLSKTARTSMAALTDYVAMVVLTQIDPYRAPMAHPSVLNVFEEPDLYPEGMTDWDIDYMHAVYDADLNRNSVAGHRAEVTRALTERRRQRSSEDVSLGED